MPVTCSSGGCSSFACGQPWPGSPLSPPLRTPPRVARPLLAALLTAPCRRRWLRSRYSGNTVAVCSRVPGSIHRAWPGSRFIQLFGPSGRDGAQQRGRSGTCRDVRGPSSGAQDANLETQRQLSPPALQPLPSPLLPAPAARGLPSQPVSLNQEASGKPPAEGHSLPWPFSRPQRPRGQERPLLPVLVAHLRRAPVLVPPGPAHRLSLSADALPAQPPRSTPSQPLWGPRVAPAPTHRPWSSEPAQPCGCLLGPVCPLVTMAFLGLVPSPRRRLWAPCTGSGSGTQIHTGWDHVARPLVPGSPRLRGPNVPAVCVPGSSRGSRSPLGPVCDAPHPSVSAPGVRRGCPGEGLSRAHLGAGQPRPRSRGVGPPHVLEPLTQSVSPSLAPLRHSRKEQGRVHVLVPRLARCGLGAPPQSCPTRGRVPPAHSRPAARSCALEPRPRPWLRRHPARPRFRIRVVTVTVVCRVEMACHLCAKNAPRSPLLPNHP